MTCDLFERFDWLATVMRLILANRFGRMGFMKSSVFDSENSTNLIITCVFQLTNKRTKMQLCFTLPVTEQRCIII